MPPPADRTPARSPREQSPAVIQAYVCRSADEATVGGWPAPAPAGIDQSHAYLRFREHVEPGHPVTVVARDGFATVGAFHGCLTTPATALFSHPWKMLADRQFLRLDQAVDPGAVVARHEQLLADLAGHAADPGAAVLTDRLGPLLVVRGFDTSAALLPPGQDEAMSRAAVEAMLLRLQELVGSGAAGGIALPFVHPCDTLLRAALTRRGFCAGTLTGASAFDLAAARSYEEFVAALPKRRRRRYRNEQAAFEKSGLTAETVALDDHLDRLVDLEARNAERYGGTPDRTRLAGVRAEMSRLLGSAIRVLVVRRKEAIIACGIDLVDDDSYLGLVYGCDYSVPERSFAYPYLVFYDPIRFATQRRLRRVRLGFEAFAPKLYRGAQLETRETWIWLPDEAARRAAGRLLGFFTGRASEYFTTLVDSDSPRYVDGRPTT